MMNVYECIKVKTNIIPTITMIIENSQKLVCQTYFFSQKHIFTPKTSCYSHTIHSRWGCVFFTQNVPGTCRAPGLLKHKKLRAARYPLVRQWLNPGWFARHLKAMCFPTRKKQGVTTVYNWRKDRTVNDDIVHVDLIDIYAFLLYVLMQCVLMHASQVVIITLCAHWCTHFSARRRRHISKTHFCQGRYVNEDAKTHFEDTLNEDEFPPEDELPREDTFRRRIKRRRISPRRRITSRRQISKTH